MVTCFVSLAALVYTLDARAAEHTRSVIAGALSSELSSMAASAHENGRWDEAVEHLYGELDMRWATDTISGTSITYVFDEHGRSLFSLRSDGRSDPPLAVAAPEAFKQLLGRLPKTPASARAMKRGLSLLGLYRGQPAIFGAMPLVPLRPSAPFAEQDIRYIGYVTPIDASLLAHWKRSFRIAGLDVVQGEAEAGLPIVGDDKRVIGALVWQQERPGLAALVTVSPVVALSMAILIGLSASIYRGMRKQGEALMQAVEEQRRAAEDAKAATESAERAALLASEASRRESLLREENQLALVSSSHAIGSKLRVDIRSLAEELERVAGQLDDRADLTASIAVSQQGRVEQIRDASERASAAMNEIDLEVRQFTTASSTIRSAASRAETRVGVAKARSRDSETASLTLLARLEAVDQSSARIQKISAETNMLALNAAIEAARSATSDSGFAVVASEVKALALRSGATAAQISEFSKEISAAAKVSVSGCEAVHGLMEEVHSRITEAALAAAHQDAHSVEILKRLERAADEASSVGCAVEDIAAAATKVAEHAAATRATSATLRSRVRLLNERLDESIAALMKPAAYIDKHAAKRYGCSWAQPSGIP